MQHSEWSPSGFKQVMLCPGSKVLQAGAPRTTSKYSAEGTAAHTLLTDCLNAGCAAATCIGDIVIADGMEFVVDDDMARHVQVTLDYVNDLVAQGGILLVDRRVHFGSYIDQPDEISFGTLDVAVILGTELISIDFKYGMGVEVSAGHDQVLDFGNDMAPQLVATRRQPNPQLALYGLGILAEVKEIADIERVRLVISQPRITTKPSEYDLSVEELEAWAYGAARSAVITALNARQMDTSAEDWQGTYLTPGEEQCRFCKAKAACPALRAEVAASVFGESVPTPDEFTAALAVHPAGNPVPEPVDKWLSACLGKVDLIEDWCKAVRAEVERRLLAGETVPGYKVVQGKMGNRSWVDAAQAEEQLKAMRLKVEEMYDLSLISPTSAEKLAPKLDKAGKPVPPKEGQPAPAIGPRQWQKLQGLITRKQGKPHVAPLSDPRPPLVITPVADEFEAAGPDVVDFS